MGSDFFQEPADAVQGVRQVVVTGTGDIDGEIGHVDPAGAQLREIQLDRRGGAVQQAAGEGDSAFGVRAARGVRTGETLAAAPQQADDGVVVRVDD